MGLGGSAKSLPWSNQKELTSPEGWDLRLAVEGLKMPSGQSPLRLFYPLNYCQGALLRLSPFLPFTWFGGLILF